MTTEEEHRHHLYKICAIYMNNLVAYIFQLIFSSFLEKFTV